MKAESRWFLLALTVAVLGTFGERTGALPEVWWYAPWALSLVLFGLPHGAIDHEVVLRLWRPQPPPKWGLSAVLAAYLAVSVVILWGWFVFPEMVFAGFVLLTWAHWGLADLWWSWHRDPESVGSRAHRVAFALWRGALPMLVPLVAEPRFYREVAEATCNLFLKESVRFAWLEDRMTVQAVLVFIIFLGAVELIFSSQRLRRNRTNLAESLALLVFFGLLPAIASIGLYFAFWHGLRHILRLNASEGLAWGRFFLRATPATVGALAMLCLLAWLTPAGAKTGQLLGVYLALIAALTVPHAMVVTWQDLRVGLWKKILPD